MKVNDFLFQANIDNINMFQLQAYFQRSEISKKVNGFVIKQNSDVDASAPASPSKGSEYVSKHVSALRSVESFLQALSNADKDGRILLSHEQRCVAAPDVDTEVASSRMTRL